jgi:phosphate:Na+ symporter
MTNFVFLDLLGGVSLLVWGLHMVRSGVVRAFGSDLRRLLGTALRNRVRAFLAGLAVTAVLQSSTATALMTTSFAAWWRWCRRSPSCLARTSARR